MKKILSLLLVLAVVFVGGSVSAYSPDSPSKQGMKDREARMEERQKKQEERKAQAEERKAQLVEIFEEYNPEGLPAFNELNDAHESFHDEQKALSEAWRQEHRTEAEEMKAKFDNGEITQEEFDAYKESFRAEMSAYREEAKVLRDEKKEELSVVREQRKSIHEEVKAMRDSGEVDSARMVELLNSITGLGYDHLAVDEKYAELINSLRSNY